MKKSELRQIIKEEILNISNEKKDKPNNRKPGSFQNPKFIENICTAFESALRENKDNTEVFQDILEKYKNFGVILENLQTTKDGMALYNKSLNKLLLQ